MSSVVSTSSTDRLSFRFTLTLAGGGVGHTASLLTFAVFSFVFLTLSEALTLTLLAGEVNSSERLLLFLFFAAEEALPEVSLGAEAAAPKDRDRCFGGMIVEMIVLLRSFRSLLCVVAVVL